MNIKKVYVPTTPNLPIKNPLGSQSGNVSVILQRQAQSSSSSANSSNSSSGVSSRSGSPLSFDEGFIINKTIPDDPVPSPLPPRDLDRPLSPLPPKDLDQPSSPLPPRDLDQPSSPLPPKDLDQPSSPLPPRDLDQPSSPLPPKDLDQPSSPLPPRDLDQPPYRPMSKLYNTKLPVEDYLQVKTNGWKTHRIDKDDLIKLTQGAEGQLRETISEIGMLLDKRSVIELAFKQDPNSNSGVLTGRIKIRSQPFRAFMLDLDPKRNPDNLVHQLGMNSKSTSSGVDAAEESVSPAIRLFRG